MEKPKLDFQFYTEDEEPKVESNIDKIIPYDEEENYDDFMIQKRYNKKKYKATKKPIKEYNKNFRNNPFGNISKYNSNNYPQQDDNDKYFYSYEGNLMIINYFDGYWNIQAPYNKDAFKNQILNTTYGDLFVKGLEEDNIKFKLGYENNNILNELAKKLNINYIYTFLLLTNKMTRKICRNEFNILYVGRFDKFNKKYEEPNETLGFKCMMPIPTIQNIKEFVNNIDINKYQGLFIIRRYKNEILSWKIINSDYQNILDNILDNDNNFTRSYYRSLIYHNEDIFLKLYDDRKDDIDEANKKLFHLVKYLQNKYISRYIEHKPRRILYGLLEKELLIIRKKFNNEKTSYEVEFTPSIDDIRHHLLEKDPNILLRLVNDNDISFKKYLNDMEQYKNK